MTELVQRALCRQAMLEERPSRRLEQFAFGMDEDENLDRMCSFISRFGLTCHVDGKTQ
jgi:hypothetical protein